MSLALSLRAATHWAWSTSGLTGQDLSVHVFMLSVAHDLMSIALEVCLMIRGQV